MLIAEVKRKRVQEFEHTILHYNEEVTLFILN